MGSEMCIRDRSYDATEDDLRKAFSTHGKLKDVHLAMDKERNRPKGFAFVTLSSKDEAKKAIKALNNTEFMGRRISVEESNSQGRSRSKGRRRR